MSDAPANYACPFCAIVAGVERDNVATRQAEVVLRAPGVTAFVASDQWPNNPGHILVVPNEHFENLYTLPTRLAEPLQDVIRNVALALKEAYRCPGTSTRQHNESAGGQDVWHYHVHVFPRFENDQLYGSERIRINPDARAHQAARLRDVLADQPREG